MQTDIIGFMKRTLLTLLAVGGALFLQTSPGAAQETCSHCVVVYGDTRTNHDIHKKMVALILARKPEAVFHIGDMVGDGRVAADWDKFNEITGELRKKVRFYPARGNHEQLSPDYFKVFGIKDWIPWYSTDLHGIHFAVLDSETPFWKGTPQYKWLQNDLKKAAAAPGNKFLAVLLHRPVYSTSEHGTMDPPIVAEALVPLFEEYGVDAVFSGHDHDYERSYKNGIYYVVAGSGGAPLHGQISTNTVSQVFAKSYNYLTISLAAGTIKAEVYDDSDKPIDAFEIAPKTRKPVK